MKFEDSITLLTTNALFKGLPDYVLFQLGDMALEQKLDSGSVLGEWLNAAGELHLLVQGKVAISTETNGGELIRIVLEPGDWIGLSALMPPPLPLGQMRALTAITLLRFYIAGVRALLRQEPEAEDLVMSRAASIAIDRYKGALDAVQRHLLQDWQRSERREARWRDVGQSRGANA